MQHEPQTTYLSLALYCVAMWNVMSTCSISWRPSVHILRVIETFCPHAPYRGDLLSTFSASLRPSVHMLHIVETYPHYPWPSVHILHVIETFCLHAACHGDLLSSCSMTFCPHSLRHWDLGVLWSPSVSPALRFPPSSGCLAMLSLFTRVSMTDPSSYVQLLMPPPATIGSKRQYVLRPSVRPLSVSTISRAAISVLRSTKLSQILISRVGIAETFFNIT